MHVLTTAPQMRLNPQKYWRMVDPTTGLPGGVDHDIPTGDAYVGHGLMRSDCH